MDKSELPFLSASEVSGLIASREVSPVEVTEAYIDRIDSLDFKFNSYLTVTREMAMDAAREAEQEIAAGRHRGADAWRTRRRKGPVQQRRSPDHWRLAHPGGLCAGRGCHRHSQP